MMENPARLHENFQFLSKKMDELKHFRDNFACTKVHMPSWLKEANDKEKEFEALQHEVRAFKGYNLNSRFRVNKNVIDLLKSVTVLLNSLDDLTALDSPVNGLIVTCDLTGKKPMRFTHVNLSSFTSNFSKKIDDHSSGNVYKGIFPNGVQVVVKILTEIDVVEPIFMAELNKMFNVRHRNLVKLYGFCFEKDLKTLVFEYMPNGSLDRILFDDNHTNMEWEKLYSIATEIAKGLSYLHEGCDDELLHCDLKAGNVLLDQNMRPKITNYGVLKLTDKEELTHFTLTELGEDVSYLAPERMLSPVTQKSDVYNFGMMLFEVLGKRRIVSREAFFPKFISKKFEQGKVEEIMKECNITEKNRENAMILCMVAFWCIQYTPENRPSMSTVIKMLEHEIKVEKPPTPFFPDKPYSMKPFVGATYDFSDFGLLKQTLES